MRIKRSIILLIISHFLLLSGLMGEEKDKTYHFSDDSLVLETIEDWQDLKFGLFMHWGPYSQWGIVESWSLCPEDHSFTSVRPKDKSYFEYVQDYENLIETFNPVEFDPNKWATAAKEAGMKYVIFTTKHHDGFNMFDTHESDYKITSDDCPFHTNPCSNVTKEVFETFRQKGFMAGAYFSITDWHNNDYWWDYFPPSNRRINYSPKKYPEKWEKLNDFIYSQLNELTGGDYGELGLLWFDLCYISPEKVVDWERFATMVRKNQPGIMMVARGEEQYEDYLTPEQKVPDKALDYPWESCMTMGNSWSYKPDDDYKSVHELVQLLVKIVSRGGNFLLNIGPGPDGDFDPVAYQRLKGIGEWIKINGEGIYGTKPIAPFHETKLAFTNKNEDVYAFYLADEGETEMPAQLFISSMQPPKASQVFLLGYNKPLKWKYNGTGFLIEIPEVIQKRPLCNDSWGFKFQQKAEE